MVEKTEVKGVNITKDTHNRHLSIAKGLGIVLMVVGHAGCPDYLRRFIYLFHMVLFYFLSGYFFNFMRLQNNSMKFIAHKYMRLFFPYVKWSVIFVLLHNFFTRIGFNSDSLTTAQMFVNIKCSIRGWWQGEHFLGAYWFLTSLFYTTILFSLIIFICKNNLQKLIVVSLCLCGVGFAVDFEFFQMISSRELVVLPFFTTAYVMKQRGFHMEKNVPWMMVPALILCVFAFNTEISVGACELGHPVVFIVVSTCGILLILQIARLIEHNMLGILLDYVGGVHYQS